MFNLVVVGEKQTLDTFLQNAKNAGKWRIVTADAVSVHGMEFMPDVVFIDTNLQDSYSLAKQFLKESSRINIVFITDRFDGECREKMVESFSGNFGGFMFTPYGEAYLLSILNKFERYLEHQLTVTTFGDFNASVFGKDITFKYAKSKELLAFLINKMGMPVKTAECKQALGITHDGYYNSTIKSNLIETLKANGLNDVLNHDVHGVLSLNRKRIICDLWSALETGNYSKYKGYYMEQYYKKCDEKSDDEEPPYFWMNDTIKLIDKQSKHSQVRI